MDSKQDPQILQGLGVSPGVAIGRAVCLSIHHLEVYRIPIPAADVDAEVARLRDATQQTRIELEATRKRAHEQLGDGLAGIFEAQSMLLEDASFVNRVERTNSYRAGQRRMGRAQSQRGVPRPLRESRE